MRVEKLNVVCVFLLSMGGLIALGYIAFLNSPRYGQEESLDKKLMTISENILDLNARLTRVEEENVTLFRLLRNPMESGYIPEPTPVRVLPPIPQPMPKPKPIGSSVGDVGDVEPSEDAGIINLP